MPAMMVVLDYVDCSSDPLPCASSFYCLHNYSKFTDRLVKHGYKVINTSSIPSSIEFIFIQLDTNVFSFSNKPY